jgi:hypothetical protein
VTALEPLRLHPGDRLMRTAEGTRRMSARDSDLSPRLRSVLFLVTGRSTVAETLEGAGVTRNVLQGQIITLIEMGLVDAVGAAPAPAAPACMPGELPPVAGAKIELLRRLEASGSCEASLLADELLDARTLRELALRAREIAYRLRDVDGNAIAERFWNEAKQILVTWRDLASGSGH